MVFIGLDIGTASSKAVAVTEKGQIVAQASRPHHTSSPRPGWYEHDADAVWWGDTIHLLAELLTEVPADQVEALCVSGIGPCVLVTDEMGQPLRPAILYGIDSRATTEIEEMTRLLGEETLLEHCGNRLTTQAVGPKLAWIARNEPHIWHKTRRWFSASNFIVFCLTGEYIVDHYTASGSSPLYDLPALGWWDRGWEASASGLLCPTLAWPGETVGTITAKAAALTGLKSGTRVLAGTIDALAEAYSVGSRNIGDTMIMYGSTLFMIQTVRQPAIHAGLWTLTGRMPGTYSLAAGMATSGLVTTWFADIVGNNVSTLVEEASQVPAGAEGLVLLPYFSGERTPLFDPQARGCWLGLTLNHTPGHLYRSILEGVAYGVRHNLETMREAGAQATRLLAVGGGTRGSLWVQIVSDVTAMPQELAGITIGASYGDARMAADASEIDTAGWNPAVAIVEPSSTTAASYDNLYGIYRRMYPALREEMHRLAAFHA
ncbi:sugar kinase [Ktedonobacteria bacterium brp13]|nr:sugar kinase [Ktedonobacteria bacterium brp13]